jgi:ribosome-associated protein
MKDSLASVKKDATTSFEVLKRVVGACEDVKGKDVAVLDVHSISDFSDYFVVVSGRSDRQVQGITNRVVEQLAELGVYPSSVEGYDDAQWVLIDCGDVVVHVFYEPMREHYDIESLWIRGHKMQLSAA